MRIQATTNLNNATYKHNNIRQSNFKGLSPCEIEQKLLNDNGIKANFNGNQLVADCINKTVDIYKHILGNSFLPKIVNFISFSKFEKGTNLEFADGFFRPSDYSVNINSDKTAFNKNNFDLLKAYELMGYRWLFNNDFSILHPLHTFVHEFAHCSHYRNLEKQGTVDNWNWMSERKLSKLEYQFDGGRLGSYAQTDLLEYLAEVISKEILSNTGRTYPNGYLYIGNLSLDCIKPDNSSTSHSLNTYNIWNGYKDNIEPNLSKRAELGRKIDDAMLTMHMLRW